MLKKLQTFLEEREVSKEIYENIGYLVQGGSTIFGTNNADSDIDLRGIVLPTEDFLIGLKEFEQLKKAEGEGRINLKDDIDIELFSFEYFFKQAVNGYAIPMEMLFLKPEHVMLENDFFKEMLEAKKMFLTQKMIRHYLGMNKKFVYGYDIKTGNIRNPLSRGRVEKFGYETKNASKALQHFYVIKELMETGEMNIYRDNREHLLAVKEGKFTKQQVKEEIDALQIEVEAMLKNTTLPENVDFEQANQLYKQMIKKILNKVEG